MIAGDLATIDAVIKALYESTRHTREHPQDWERFRSLFLPNAVLVQGAVYPDRSYLDLTGSAYGVELALPVLVW